MEAFVLIPRLAFGTNGISMRFQNGSAYLNGNISLPESNDMPIMESYVKKSAAESNPIDARA